jgi:hypothetical protein
MVGRDFLPIGCLCFQPFLGGNNCTDKSDRFFDGLRQTNFQPAPNGSQITRAHDTLTLSRPHSAKFISKKRLAWGVGYICWLGAARLKKELETPPDPHLQTFCPVPKNSGSAQAFIFFLIITDLATVVNIFLLIRIIQLDKDETWFWPFLYFRLTFAHQPTQQTELA